MIRKNLTLSTMLAAIAFVAIQSASQAATLQFARSNSTISEDNKSSITVSVNVYKVSTPSSPQPQLSGAITIAGRTGNLDLTLNCCPQAVTFSSDAIKGVTYQHAEITTLPFSFLNLKTQQRTPAWMQMHLTRGSDGSQRLGFQIFAVSSGALLMETEVPNAAGVYGDLPLLSGSELIHF